jgi:hypothetical protein
MTYQALENAKKQEFALYQRSGLVGTVHLGSQILICSPGELLGLIVHIGAQTE